MAVVLVVGRSVPARYTSPSRARHRMWFLFCLSSQPACDFIPRRHQCLCFSRGMVPVPMVGLRGLSVRHRAGGSTRELPTHRHLLTHLSRAVPQPTHPGSRGDILARLFRDGTKPRCMQKEVHRALVVRAMLVGCSVTANTSRRRSLLRPTILAPRPRCCRAGFLYTAASFSRAYAVTPHRKLVRKKTPIPGAPRRRSAEHRSSARCAFGARRPRF